jgi:hypothetical protein
LGDRQTTRVDQIGRGGTDGSRATAGTFQLARGWWSHLSFALPVASAATGARRTTKVAYAIRATLPTGDAAGPFGDIGLLLGAA